MRLGEGEPALGHFSRGSKPLAGFSPLQVRIAGFREEMNEKATGAAAPDFPASLSPLARVAGMLRRNPRAAWSLLNYEFQRAVGHHLNRRLYPEKSLLPSYLSLNPTRRCNLRCRMCIQHRHSPVRLPDLPWYQPDKELPLEAWIALFEEVTAWRPVLFITGGEPLLYSHILDFIEEAKKRRLVVHLQTNGILLEKVADHLVELGVDMVTVSLDGPPPVHDFIRGQGTFERSSRGLRALRAAQRRRLQGPHKSLASILDGGVTHFRRQRTQRNVYFLDRVPALRQRHGDRIAKIASI